MKKLLSLIVTLGVIFSLAVTANAQSAQPQTIADGSCGTSLNWTLTDDYTLTISGSGAMENYWSSNTSSANPGWEQYKKQIKQVVVEEGVTSLGSRSFYHCTALTDVSLPSTLKTIGSEAFYFCTQLDGITVPDSVVKIGDGAFGNCMALTDITLSANITEIAPWLFAYCENLETVTVPQGVTCIREYSFYCCPALADITIPASVTDIGELAFYAYGADDIATVRYGGSPSRWDKINAGQYNDRLLNSSVRFAPLPDGAVRLFGASRYETSFIIADGVKVTQDTGSFDTIILANGENFADALAGSYLAKVKNAPILMANGKNNADIAAFADKHLAADGTVYILGGTAALPQTLESDLGKFTVKRLAGASRFETNIEILKEAGVTDGEILVCTAYNFADSLSASAAGRPILLVDSASHSLTDVQKAYLDSLSGGSFCIIGGENAVSAKFENQLSAYGDVSRLAGASRFETSVMVAEKYVPDPDHIVLAYSHNFPDGLCGGPLAASLGAPLILTSNGNEAAAQQYVQSQGIQNCVVLGGSGLVSDSTVKNICGKDVTVW